jgi:hypothetical protein
VPGGTRHTGEVLSDEEIAGLSPAARRDLIKRLAAPVGELEPASRWLVRTRDLRLGITVLCAGALLPWSVYLGLSLPQEYVVRGWNVTWAGFDALMFLLMLATAVLGWRRRQLVMLTMFALGVMLLCDVWFDLTTSDGDDVPGAVLAALLIEIPLAVFFLVTSLQMLRLVAARLWSLDQGEHAWQIRIPLPSDADRAVRRDRSAAR